MKKFLKFSSLLLGFSLIAGGLAVGGHKVSKETKAAEEYEKAEGGAVNWVPIESASDINTTDPFLIGYSMPNGTRYFSTNGISSGTVTVDSDFSKANVIRFVENITKDAYLVKLSTSKYLTNSSSTACSASTGSDWIVNDFLYLVNKSNSDRILGRASKDAGAGFKAYAANNVPAANPPAIIYKYDSSKTEVDVDGVSLDTTEKTIMVGESFDLTATVSPTGATDKSVSWSSSEDSVATVVDGHVEALAVGETTITVTTTDGGFTATCKVTVEKNPYNFDTLSKTSLSLGSGYTKYTEKKLISSAEYFLYVTTNGNNIQSNKNSDATKHYGIVTTKTGGLAKSVTVNFADNNTNVYQIYGSNVAYTDPDNLYDADTKGTLIEEISASKTITISSDYQYLGFYSSAGANYIASIVVKWEPVKPTSIDVADDSLELTLGGSADIVPELVNGDLIVSETEVEYSSDNAAVTVDATGHVVGVSEGTANITIKSKADNTVTKTVAVTVAGAKIGVSSVSLDKTEITVKEKHNETLSETVLPADATVKTVTWSSSDETIATVDQSGVVTGVKAGTATIKVESTDDATKYAECAVTVEERETQTFELVDSEAGLIEGAHYAVVGVKDTTVSVMAHYVSGNNVKAADVEFKQLNNAGSAVKEDVEESFYTLLKDENGNWLFFDGTNYLYAAGGASNSYMKSHKTIDDNTRFAISFDGDGLISVVAQGEAGCKNMRYNYNGGTPLFSCYADGKQAQIYLYRAVSDSASAEAFAESFMAATNLICPASDEDLNRGEALAEQWDSFKEMYEGLGSSEKEKILSDTPSALIEAMLERYDYIVAKYSLENFITGHVVSSVNGLVRPAFENNNNAVTIIVIVSVVSISCLGALIVIKRRKVINN